jgi:hypothetical protein
MPVFVPCGSRGDALRRFSKAVRVRQPSSVNLLLVDSEAPISQCTSVWEHVRQREEDGWKRPIGASESQLHFMVQCMEAWFLADIDALSAFYGKGFRHSVFAKRSIEQISKEEVGGTLKAAARATTKREYDKGRHSFEILRRIDLHKLESASPFAKRFFDHLRSVC